MITGKAIPYYRFMNASAASMALVGLGAFAAIHWFFTDRAPSKLIGWAGVGLVAWSAARVRDARSLDATADDEAVAFLPNFASS